MRAAAKWVRMSPRKARLVVEHIRGRSVPEARTVLAFTQRAAARDIEKVLRSAVANAEANHGLDRRRARRRGGVRRRGPDAEALARPRARSRRPDPQAHLPHHGQARADSRSSAPPEPQCRSRRRRAEGRAEAQRSRSDEAGAEDRRERRAEARRRPRRRRLMGQKIHPGGLRVGVIHDWKSNWYTSDEGVRGRPARGHQDPRAHLRQARPRGPVRHPDPQGQAADHDRHLHGAARDRDRQVGRRGGRAAQGGARA